MTILIIGTGGVGGFFGAKLAAAGFDVTFMARGAHFDAIKTNGLRVKSIDGDMHIFPAKVVQQPEKTYDLVVVATKVYHITDSAEAIRQATGPDTTVLPLCNGIEANILLENIIDKKHILGGLCRIFSSIAEPGVIQHTGFPGPTITFGEMDNSLSERVIAIETLLTKSGIKHVLSNEIQVEIWRKFIFIASTSLVGAATRVPFGEFIGCEASFNLLKNIIREMISVARALHIALPDNEFERQLEFTIKQPPKATTSMQRDILEGKVSELEHQGGALVRTAGAAGIDVPYTTAIYAALLPQELRTRKNY